MPSPRNRGFSRRGRSGPLRRMIWTGAATNATLTVAPSGVAAEYTLLPSEARLLTEPTLIRTRGQLHIALPLAGAIRGAWGLIRWEDNNDTPPAAADTPLPYSNPDFEWLLHEYFFANSIDGAGRLGQAASIGPGVSLDSRAMRKLPNPCGILFVAELAATSTQSVSILWGFRHLLKE